MLQDRNEALKQKKALQQQCTSAIMKWNTATKEKGDLETELKLVRKDRDEYMESFNQVSIPLDLFIHKQHILSYTPCSKPS